MRPLSADRILNRLSRELVGRFGVPPAACGYRFLNVDAPSSHDYRLIHPPTVSRVPLPRNVASRDDLSRRTERWGFSFFDVPDRRVRETFVATVPNCRILSAPDQWGDRHYAILTRDERVLNVRGTGYERDLHAGLMAHKSESVPRIGKGTWILELWNQNYSHWLQWHLVKVALLQELGRGDDIIVPGSNRLAAVVESSLECLGLRTEALPRLETAILDVDELTVVGIDDFRASLLEGLRKRFPRQSDAPPMRKLFISREKASRRRLANEARCWEILRPRGYERVIMEDHDFRQQVALMSNAAVLFALHGAGMTNIIFAPPALHVIEISDVTFPSPHFYALAGALGHHYWLLDGHPAGELRPGYHDVSVDPADVEVTVERVEAALSADRPR